MNNQSLTFAKVFESWFNDHYCHKVKPGTYNQTCRIMSSSVLPVIGDTAIDQITPKQVLDLCNDIAKTRANKARRIAFFIENVLDYALVVLNVIEYNKISSIKKYLPQKPTPKGRQYVKIAQLPYLFADMAQDNHCHDVVERAFWVLVYTGLRRSEVAYAKKCEFDFDKKLWVIPAERMKIGGNGSHTVPLSRQVIDLVAPLMNSQSEFVFSLPTRPDRPINAWSVGYLLRKSQWHNKQTLHGFRKIFSTHAHESGRWNIDAIELSLAHKIGGVRGVYNHATFMTERTNLMQWWANEVDNWRGIANV
ncbi:site-specific integrase [Moraxella sp.]|uniref:tyrosine-type recombinase/integrase n=1 Tax=Moraxella sp. TaxID=479 RepID=UPI0026DD900B|nr:tyrosine-type recombinase/integrase [Moraxella sp.]MDO4895661.1 tyrosine-type recombinase/integrase [Moraxella sp.]